MAGSIRGGREYAHGLRLIAETLEGLGHEVLTKEFVVNVNPLEETSLRDGAIFERDVKKIQESDVFIAEVSQGSHGVGFEHCFSLMTGRPALLLRHASLLSGDASRSAFLSGPSMLFPKSRFAYYNVANIWNILEGFFVEFFSEDREGRIGKER